MTLRLVRLEVVAASVGIMLTACGGSSSTSATPQTSPAASTIIRASQSSSSPTGRPLVSGQLIAFERLVTGSDNTDLYVVPPGGGQARLVRREAGTPHWSPDGQQLSFLACL